MSFVTYEQDGYVGVITINRLEALNALNVQVLKDLDAVIDNINLDETRAVIVTGAGEKAFVAGADIAAMSTMTVKEGRDSENSETISSGSWKRFRSPPLRLSMDLPLAAATSWP